MPFTAQKEDLRKLLRKSDTFKLVIPAEVEQKIRFTCSNVWDLEWSGILFYEYKGSFGDADFTVICKDFYIMDIGIPTFTMFDMSPDIVEYMANNPELLDCQTGLIHSHCGMPTFFSSTDLDTLKAEGYERNHFLSLIVNNKGIYTAAITRKAHHKTVLHDSMSYRTFEDRNSETVINSTEEEEDVVEYFMLNITTYTNSSVSDRVKEIQEKKDAANRKYMATSTPYIPSADKSSHLFANKENSAETNRSKQRKYDNLANKDYKYTSYFEDTKPLPSPAKSEYINDCADLQQQTSTKIFLDYSKQPGNDSTQDNEETELPYESLTTDEEVIESIVLQLITGCVLVKPGKINVEEWIKNMQTSFSQRFANSCELEAWADPFIEHLLYYTKDNTNYKYKLKEDEGLAVLAYNIIRKLEEVTPQNDVIGIYISILERYIL